MKLYVAHISPYARLTRIMVHEKGLYQRVGMEFRPTRMPNNPIYEFQPSGRIPSLVLDDGTVYEDSALICAYLDRLDGRPQFTRPDGDEGWAYWRSESMARSMMDGLSVWLRELQRPEGERSTTIIEHERQRGLRIADAFDREIALGGINQQIWCGPFNMIQMTLITALQMELRLDEFDWRRGRPGLAAWAQSVAKRPSIEATYGLE